jgi:iron-sulfur cluster repair protein YtfE (RIC family)
MPASKSRDKSSIGSAAVGTPLDVDSKAVLETAARELEKDIQKLLAKNADLVKLIAEKAALQPNADDKTRPDIKAIQTKIAAEISQFNDKLADLNQLSAKVAMLAGSAKMDFTVLSRLKEELNQAIHKLTLKNERLRAQKQKSPNAPSIDTSPKRPRR